jgi:maltooligosyltrehalose trehalohydrolase
MTERKPNRRLPIGAEPQPAGGVHFRVWAPRRRRVDVVLVGGAATELSLEEDGFFAGVVAAARTGSLYQFRLDGGSYLYPDPVSRCQPEGPHGPSQVIDPSTFSWTDASWRGIQPTGQVIYELHVGTFTREGTWAAAMRELPELASLGITVIEMMPVAEFPGRFGWGYDGVDLFAPTRLYGTPDDLRRYIDRAHSLGVGVILDVVYNHFGPDGNYLKQFAEEYFTDRHKNEWGEALNFDGERSGPVREFFVANAGYWIDEYHFDGLRLDATQQIFDASEDHILAAVCRRVREAARGRATFIAAENEEQHAPIARPTAKGGCGLDAVWNDDLHHSAIVALTGHNDAYYADFHGAPQEFISAVKYGYLYQGQWYAWQKKRRGKPALDLSPGAFVTYIENHDQVANSGRGLRLWQMTSPGRLKAMTALLLLAPQTPLIFQGQEFASSRPFLFFADHNPDLAKLVHKGRGAFLAQFCNLALPETQAILTDPADPSTFQRCKLDFGERERHAEVYALHRDLLKLRREDPVLCAPRPRGVDGAVLGPQAFVLRFFGEAEDRLLVVNLGRDLHLEHAPEPLLAPPEESIWEIRWSSEDTRYGGCGTPALEGEENWRIPGEAAVLLVPGSPPMAIGELAKEE